MNKIIFKNLKYNSKKLCQFGFVKKNDKFILNKKILNNEFNLEIVVFSDNTLSTKLSELSSGEIYTLHLAPSSSGEFVGAIKEQYQKILDEIKEKCFDNDVFQFAQTKKIIDFVKTTYNDNLEYLWEKTPNAAIWRRKDNKKWYGVIMRIEKSKLKIKSSELVEILNLKLNPSDITKLVDNKKYFLAYHMNKKHWISVILDDTNSDREIYNLLKTSYNMSLG